MANDKLLDPYCDYLSSAFGLIHLHSFPVGVFIQQDPFTPRLPQTD
jgi:hypothetical protein